eukprot:scaffold526_cov356-Prasinococcus_capsulatus_cf.AAC.5
MAHRYIPRLCRRQSQRAAVILSNQCDTIATCTGGLKTRLLCPHEGAGSAIHTTICDRQRAATATATATATTRSRGYDDAAAAAAADDDDDQCRRAAPRAGQTPSGRREGGTRSWGDVEKEALTVFQPDTISSPSPPASHRIVAIWDLRRYASIVTSLAPGRVALRRAQRLTEPYVDETLRDGEEEQQQEGSLLVSGSAFSQRQSRAERQVRECGERAACWVCKPWHQCTRKYSTV